MAGERMKLRGFVEVSAVRTHPDCRGRGYAAQLTSTVTSQILARGKAAFLRAYASNTAGHRFVQSARFCGEMGKTASQIRDPEPQTLRAA